MNAEGNAVHIPLKGVSIGGVLALQMPLASCPSPSCAMWRTLFATVPFVSHTHARVMSCIYVCVSVCACVCVIVCAADGWTDPVEQMQAIPGLMFNLGLADDNQKKVWCTNPHCFAHTRACAQAHTSTSAYTFSIALCVPGASRLHRLDGQGDSQRRIHGASSTLFHAFAASTKACACACAYTHTHTPHTHARTHIHTHPSLIAHRSTLPSLPPMG